jgi:hypothetical protein
VVVGIESEDREPQIVRYCDVASQGGGAQPVHARCLCYGNLERCAVGRMLVVHVHLDVLADAFDLVL